MMLPDAAGTARDVDAVLARHADEIGGQPAVITVGERAGVLDTMTFAELHAATRTVAATLAERYPVGSRLLLGYPQGVDFVPVFLGCVTAGMVGIPVPPPGQSRYHAERLSRIAQDAGVEAVLTDGSCADDLRGWARRTGSAEMAVVCTDDWSRPGTAASGSVPAVPDLVSGPHLSDPGHVVLLQYTSGSTSRPKGVMVTSGNIFSNVHTQSAILGAHIAGLRRGGWIPHHHDMGLIGHLLPGVLHGTGYVVLSATAFLKRPVRWLQAIGEFTIGLSAAPNFAYEYCVQRVTDEQRDTLDLSAWEVAVNGSEPVRAGTLRQFGDRFASAGFRMSAFAPAYGLAESTLMVTGACGRPPVTPDVDPQALATGRLAPSVNGRPLVSCGAPPDPERVAIVDPTTGAVAAEGAIGEVWLRGPCVAAGYWGVEPGPEDFAAFTDDGQGPYLRTGDLGALVAGELYLVGRRKETLLARGRTLHPGDIEDELRRCHPELAVGVGAVFSLQQQQVAATQDDQAGAGELMVVTHEVRGVGEPDQLAHLAVAMRSTVAREFGAYAAGVVLLRHNTVLRTTSGKIRRSAMREAFLAGELSVLAQRIDDDLVAQMSPAPAGPAVSASASTGQVTS